MSASVTDWVAIGLSTTSLIGAGYSSFTTRRLQKSLADIGPVAPKDLRRDLMKLRGAAQTYAQLLKDVQQGTSVVDPDAVWPGLWERLLEANSALWGRVDEVEDIRLQQSIGAACRFVIVGNKTGRPISLEDAQSISDSCDMGLARLDELEHRRGKRRTR